MFKLTRPKKPQGFDEKSKKNLDKVKKQIDEGEKPKFNEGFWKDYKNRFFESQNKKCAYCESSMNQYGDVEHYRPKSVVEEIEEEGEERENLNNLKGRKFKQDYQWFKNRRQ